MTAWYLSASCVVFAATGAKATLYSDREVGWVRICWHQRRFCSKLYWQLQHVRNPKTVPFFFLFRMAQTIPKCEGSYPADVFIGLASFSWCWECDIFAHTCTMFSTLLVDTVESPQGKQEALLLFQQTPEPRGSATSHLMTSCGRKTERLRRAHNGDQFNLWQQRWLMHSHEVQLSFSNYTWNDCCFKSREGFCVTAAHMSDAAAGTCCHSPWCQLSQPWTSEQVESSLGDLLSYKETERARLLFSERWCQAATLPGARQ